MNANTPVASEWVWYGRNGGLERREICCADLINKLHDFNIGGGKKKKDIDAPPLNRPKLLILRSWTHGNVCRYQLGSRPKDPGHLFPRKRRKKPPPKSPYCSF